MKERTQCVAYGFTKVKGLSGLESPSCNKPKGTFRIWRAMSLQTPPFIIHP